MAGSTAPTLTAQTDPAPVPRVELVFTSLAPGTQVINVYRLADNRTMPVRGGIAKFAVGGATLVDWEAPFGVPITYRAEMFSDPAGTLTLGFTDPATVTLDVQDTWLHQPLNPNLAVRAIRLEATAASVNRKAPSDLVYPQGAEVGVRIGSQRQGVSGLAFDLLVRTFADADSMQSVFGLYGVNQPGVACIRTPPPMRIPRVFFGSIDQVQEVEVDSHTGGQMVRFLFDADEVRPPAPGLVTALLRRADIDAAYATRADRASAYLTRLARDSDFSKAGLAG